MPKRKRAKNKRTGAHKTAGVFKEVLSLYTKLAELKKDVSKANEEGERVDERLTDLEVHMNILARLLTTLCIEKFGMRVGALKRLVRRVEKEAVRDSQIMELESLYKLPHGNVKKSPPAGAKPKGDPWDQIS